MSPVSRTYVIAVRACPPEEISGQGTEWFDSSTFATVQEISRNIVDKTNRMLPRWAVSHPVLRYARVRLEEVEQPA